MKKLRKAILGHLSLSLLLMLVIASCSKKEVPPVEPPPPSADTLDKYFIITAYTPPYKIAMSWINNHLVDTGYLDVDWDGIRDLIIMPGITSGWKGVFIHETKRYYNKGIIEFPTHQGYLYNDMRTAEWIEDGGYVFSSGPIGPRHLSYRKRVTQADSSYYYGFVKARIEFDAMDQMMLFYVDSIVHCKIPDKPFICGKFDIYR